MSIIKLGYQLTSNLLLKRNILKRSELRLLFHDSDYIIYRFYIESNRVILFPIPTYNTTLLKRKTFENIVEVGENAGNPHFLLF